MVKKTDKGETLVWSDQTGKYKMGYSQYLQQKALKVNALLVVCVIVLIAMLAVGFFYAHSLVQRIDALDPIARLAQFILI